MPGMRERNYHIIFPKQVSKNISRQKLYKYYNFDLYTTQDKFNNIQDINDYPLLNKFTDKISYRGLTEQFDYKMRTNGHFSKKGFFGKNNFDKGETTLTLLGTCYCSSLKQAQVIEQRLILDRMYQGYQMINKDVRHTTDRNVINIFDNKKTILDNLYLRSDKILKIKVSNDKSKKKQRWYLSGMKLKKSKFRKYDKNLVEKIRKFILISHFGHIFYHDDIEEEFCKEMKDFLGEDEWVSSHLLSKYREFLESKMN